MKNRINFRCLCLFLAAACFALAGGWGGGSGLAAEGLPPEIPGPIGDLAPASGLPVSPAYDSGWYAIGIRPDPLPVDFTHNLGGDPDDYMVNLTCKDDTSLATYDCTNYGFTPDALWYALTDTTVSVWVRSGARPDAVRVRIYDISPVYDSGWVALLARPDPIAVPFDHNVSGNPDHYLVILECKDETSLATYNCTDFNFNINADWYGLTDTAINVWVDNGPRPDEIRVRILAEPPDYDSGWVNFLIRPDPFWARIDHAVGGDPDHYLVNQICRDDTSLATYNCTGFFFNRTASWYSLSTASIYVWIESGTVPDDVRIRVWLPNFSYLPLMRKD